jgi:hypothetical protein
MHLIRIPVWANGLSFHSSMSAHRNSYGSFVPVQQKPDRTGGQFNAQMESEGCMNGRCSGSAELSFTRRSEVLIAEITANSFLEHQTRDAHVYAQACTSGGPPSGRQTPSTPPTLRLGSDAPFASPTFTADASTLVECLRPREGGHPPPDLLTRCTEPLRFLRISVSAPTQSRNPC